MERPAQCLLYLGIGDHAAADESGGSEAIFSQVHRRTSDPAALAECPEEKLLKLWEGLGYYNRVRNMQIAAQTVVEEYDGVLPASYEKLLSLRELEAIQQEQLHRSLMIYRFRQ